jgi:hypothetical protein
MVRGIGKGRDAQFDSGGELAETGTSTDKSLASPSSHQDGTTDPHPDRFDAHRHVELPDDQQHLTLLDSSVLASDPPDTRDDRKRRRECRRQHRSIQASASLNIYRFVFFQPRGSSGFFVNV